METKDENYYCKKINATVKIGPVAAILESGSTGNIIDEIPLSPTKCDHCKSCSVASENGFRISYDWGQCVHPDLQNLNNPQRKGTLP